MNKDKQTKVKVFWSQKREEQLVDPPIDYKTSVMYHNPQYWIDQLKDSFGDFFMVIWFYLRTKNIWSKFIPKGSIMCRYLTIWSMIEWNSLYNNSTIKKNYMTPCKFIKTRPVQTWYPRQTHPYLPYTTIIPSWYDLVLLRN